MKLSVNAKTKKLLLFTSQVGVVAPFAIQIPQTSLHRVIPMLLVMIKLVMIMHIGLVLLAQLLRGVRMRSHDQAARPLAPLVRELVLNTQTHRVGGIGTQVSQVVKVLVHDMLVQVGGRLLEAIAGLVLGSSD